MRRRDLICASIDRSATGCVAPICVKAVETSHAGQIAHAAPTGVAAPARPRYEMSSPEPAEMPIMPTKEARGKARFTAASCSSTSPTSPSRLNEGEESFCPPWPRRTKTHERQPRSEAPDVSHRVWAAVPVIVWRKTTIGASGGSAWQASSFAHSTVTSGSSHALKRPVEPPVSGGSTLLRSSPRRERTRASAKLALELLAHVVG